MDKMEPTLFGEDVFKKPTKNEEVYIVNNVRSIRKQEIGQSEKKDKPRVSFIFTLENKDRVKTEYLGLIDPSSSKSLISEELVRQHEMPTKTNNGVLTTNTGNFKTSEIAIASKITFPQWSEKRVVINTELSLNLDNKQKYKAILGLDFIIEKQTHYNGKQKSDLLGRNWNFDE